MSNMTPGPWHVEMLQTTIAIRGDHYTVCGINLHSLTKNPTVCAKRRECDARAISAVPELIEATRTAIQHMEWSTPQGRAAYEALRAALSKAIGE